jgi:hypothetical protein
LRAITTDIGDHAQCLRACAGANEARGTKPMAKK